MKLLKRLLPDLAAAMALGMVVLAILDSFNPFMSFLTSNCTKVYAVILGIVSVASALTVAVERARNNRR